MYQLIKGFPEQLEEGLVIAQNSSISKPSHPLHHVLITGMGGSGIGGKIVANLLQDLCKLPIVILQDYHTPNWVNKNTLAIASSYSGNTEETLSAAAQLIEKDTHFVAVTSGGQLEKVALEYGKDCIKLPGDWPAPRACLGFSLMAQLITLEKLELLTTPIAPVIERVISFLKSEQEEIEEKAHQLAPLLLNQTPIIYSSPLFEAVAIRFRQQLNENSKILAWHHVIPEMNHNEIVGWHQSYPQYAVLMLESNLAHPRTKLRTQFVRELTGHFANAVIRTKAKGRDLWEQTFYLIHLLDFVSDFLATERKVNVMSIHAIDTLKQMLKQTP